MNRTATDNRLHLTTVQQNVRSLRFASAGYYDKRHMTLTGKICKMLMDDNLVSQRLYTDCP